MKTHIPRSLCAIAAAAALASALPLSAQAQPVPSYARSVDTIKGTISSFNGATTMYVRDVKGYIDDVTLHRGTIINPTGIRLEPGFRVTVTGHPNGKTFVANEIDTPYHAVSLQPYAYAPYAYPMYFGWQPWGWGPDDDGWR